MLETPKVRGIDLCLIVMVALFPYYALADSGYFGAARILINPTTPIRLSGFASRSNLPEATEVQLDLYAQAAAFGIGADTTLLIAVDSTNIPKSVADAVTASISANHGIALERIVIASTHSHSAPHVNRPSNLFAARPLTPIEQEHVDQYTSQLISWLKQVASDALSNRSAGHQLAWGQGSVDFGNNRREMPIAPNDHDLPVMCVTDADGTIRGILTSYATHGTTLDPSDNLISGDWPGYAREAIQFLYPEAVVLVTLGAAGDSNPDPRGDVAHARNYGQAVATEVQRLIDHKLMTPVSSSISAARGEVELQFATEREPGDPPSARLAPAPGSHMYGVSSWTFGNDLAMIFLEGEATVDYSLRLKSELDRERLWVNAYCNNVQGYIPSERILYEGGYEPDGSSYSYVLPGRFAHGLEEKIIGEVYRQVEHFFFPPGRSATSRQSPHVRSHDR